MTSPNPPAHNPSASRDDPTHGQHVPPATPRVDHYGSQYGNFARQLYADVRRDTYDQDIGQNGWLTAAEQDLFIEWLALKPTDRLLDIACGSGGPTLRVADVTGCTVDGIDIHADAVTAAQRTAADRDLETRASFHCGDGSTALPFDDATFDAIMCIDAINHLPDRPHVLFEWGRVLKRNGRLVFTDPIVVTGPLTHEEVAVRASIGFFLFVPDGYNDAMLHAAGFTNLHRADRTENMATTATRWRDARDKRAAALTEIEGDTAFEGQQAFFEVCARLARERRLSRLAFGTMKS